MLQATTKNMPTPSEEVVDIPLPARPFIWRYLSHASPHVPQLANVTVGAETPYRTSAEGSKPNKEEDDTMEDEDEADEDTPNQTGISFKTGTDDDEEEE